MLPKDKVRQYTYYHDKKNQRKQGKNYVIEVILSYY